MKTKTSVSLDKEVTEWLRAHEETNTSRLVNKLLKAYIKKVGA